MTDHLITVLLSSLTILGVHEVVSSLLYTWTGRDLNDWYAVLNEPKWAKPLIFCPLCMTSVWGVPVLLAWGLHTWHILPALFALAGVTYIIDRLIP
jgi:hypothetical protein